MHETFNGALYILPHVHTYIYIHGRCAGCMRRLQRLSYPPAQGGAPLHPPPHPPLLLLSPLSPLRLLHPPMRPLQTETHHRP